MKDEQRYGGKTCEAFRAGKIIEAET